MTKLYYNCKEIDKTSADLLKQTEELASVFNHMLFLVDDDLKLYWHGADYENFKKNMKDYIESLNPIITDLLYMENCMSLVSKRSSAREREWLEKIKLTKLGIGNGNGADDKWQM